MSVPHATGPHSRTVFGRGSWSETTRVADVLRKETVGGALLLLAAAVLAVPDRARERVANSD